MGSMFYPCTALETLTLGTKFAFKGDTGLVDATWHGINTGNEYTTSAHTNILISTGLFAIALAGLF